MLANNFKKSLIAANIGLVLTAGVSGVAYANEGSKAQEDVEVIEVRGIRRSLEAAMNTKRFANAVVDAVSAEDIGKFPDNNVAEALGRVPGVTVSRQFGEGSAVSIRGASNSLTLTTLNGQNVASTGWYSQQAIDRTFNYSMLPPELISGMEVYKSSQADLLEGGVGGTVVVNTRKPLELDAMTVFGSVKATKSSIGNETDPAASALVSWKNDDENFGILAAIAKSDYTLERRGTESLPNWGGRIAPTAFIQNRERTATDFVVEYAPTDSFNMNVHYMNLELGADSVNMQVWIPQDLSSCFTNPQGVEVKCTTSAEWAAQDDLGVNSYWDVRPRNATMETSSLSTEFNYLGDGFKIKGQLGSSEATGGTNFETNVAYLSGVGGAVGTIDATGEVIQLDLADTSFPLPSAGEYVGWEGLQPNSIVNEPRTDEETYAQLDVEFDTDFDVITSIKTGIRWSEHDVERDTNRPVLKGFDGAAQAALVDSSRFQNGKIEAGMDNMLIPRANGGAMIDYTNEFVNGWIRERSGYASLNEESFAIYAMANFEGENYRGNFGLRYVSTDATSNAYGLAPGFEDPTFARNNGYSTTIVSEKHDYSEFLPSFNIAYDYSEDIIIRASAATVISRPNYNDMFSNAALIGYDDNDPQNQSVTKGTPKLSPFKANQADLGVEYYFSPSSLVSVGLFWKDVDTFTTFAETPNQSIGITDPGTNTDSWLLQSYVDGDGGDVLGLEFQVQHSFENGFGVVYNYTYADANAEAANFVDHNPIFSDSSEHTVNTVVFYEADNFSARAAYSWRSEYMIRETGFYGAREHQDFGTLDLSFTYDINENFTVVADITNLLEEDSIQLGKHQKWTDTDAKRFSMNYPNVAYQGEARYSLGLQFRF